MGTILRVGVGQPTTNAVEVTDDKGNIQAEWNGGPVHSFTGINTTVIQTARARSDQVTFNLGSPRTGPVSVAAFSHLPSHAAAEAEEAHLLRRARTSGSAVQSESVLTVTVTRTTTNTVAISNEGGGAVQVEWNGGAAHSFMGIKTIVVDTQNARKDVIALHDVTS
jgi:hypothetical protein